MPQKNSISTKPTYSGSLMITAICMLLMISVLITQTTELFHNHHAHEKQVLKQQQWLARAGAQIGRKLWQSGTSCTELTIDANDPIAQMTKEQSILNLTGSQYKMVSSLKTALGAQDHVIQLADQDETENNAYTSIVRTWAGPGAVVIENELCSYQLYDPVQRQLLGVRRGIGETEAVAHPAGARVLRDNCAITAKACSARAVFRKICSCATSWSYLPQYDFDVHRPTVLAVGSARLEDSAHIFGSTLDIDDVQRGSSLIYGPRSSYQIDNNSSTNTYAYYDIKALTGHIAFLPYKVFERTERLGGTLLSNNLQQQEDIAQVSDLDAAGLCNYLFTAKNWAELLQNQHYLHLTNTDRTLWNHISADHPNEKMLQDKRGIIVHGDLQLDFHGKYWRQLGYLGIPYLLVVDGNAHFKKATFYGAVVVLGNAQLDHVDIFGMLAVTGDLHLIHSNVYYDPKTLELLTQRSQQEQLAFRVSTQLPHFVDKLADVNINVTADANKLQNATPPAATTSTTRDKTLDPSVSSSATVPADH